MGGQGLATGTAELLQDNGVAAPEAQGATPPAENVPGPAAEAVTGQPTENGDAEQPQTPPRKAIDDLTEDELREHPRIKGEIAKREESLRQKTESDTARRLHQQAQAFVQQGGVVNEMQRLVSEGIDTGKFNPETVQRLSDALWRATISVSNASFEAAIDAGAPLEGVSQKTKDTIDRVRNGIATGRHTMEDLIAARLDGYKEAVIAAELPRLRKEVEAEIRKGDLAANETNTLRQNGEQRSAPGRSPSSLSGSAPSGRDVSSIIADSSASPAERRRAFEEKHGFSPS